MFGFEIAAASTEAEADFFLGYTNHRPQRMLAALHDLSSRGGIVEVPDGLRAFATAWAGSTALRRMIHHVWLEFDHGSSAYGLFVGVGVPVPRHASQDWLTASLAHLACGTNNNFDEILSDNALAIVRALPPVAGPVSVACFAGRTTSALRVCVCGLQLPQLVGYLRLIGCGANAEYLVDTLDRLLGASKLMGTTIGMVHLDIAESLLPRVGVELVMPIKQQFVYGVAPAPVLAALVSDKLCTQARADALIEWPRPYFADAGSATSDMHVRRVSHVKIVCGPGASSTAKIYFGAHRHLPPLTTTRTRCVVQQALESQLGSSHAES